MTSRLDRPLLFALMAAFTFGIATLWIQAQWPWTVFQAIVLSCAAVCLFGYARAPSTMSLSPWLLLPVIVVCIGMAQLASGHTENVWRTRQSTLEWVTHAAAAFLAFVVCRQGRSRRLGLRVFVLAAGTVALLSTMQNYTAPGRMLWLFNTGYADNVFGPFVYHTKLANFAELAIPVAIWLAVREPKRAFLYGVTAAVLAGAVVASASRGGMLILLVEFAVLAILAVRARGYKVRFQGLAMFAAGLALTVAVFGWELARERMQMDPMRDMRLPILMSTAAMARDFWMFGSGLGTFNIVFPQYTGFDAHIFINQAHCDWLQWLAEGGVLFPLCMAVMLGAVLRACRREWWVAGLVFVWLHGLFDYPMQQTPAFASLQLAFWGGAVAVLARGRARIPVERYRISVIAATDPVNAREWRPSI